MSKFNLFLLTFAVVIKWSVLFSQWGPDVRLTDNPTTSYTSLNNAWCIASSGSVVHVVWYDSSDGNQEIYYKRSTDGGASWGTDTRLTNNNASSEYPSVAVTSSVVHVVWSDNRDGDYEIYYKRSTDGGASWGADIRLTNSNGTSNNPSITVSGSVVHVVWHDARDANFEIYYKRSTDGGASWGADTRLTNTKYISMYPSIAVFGSVVHVVWQMFIMEEYGADNPEIYYKRSTDGGVSWEADTRLTNNISFSGIASVAVSGSVVHVVWDDLRDLNFEIYYKRSTDGGASWGSDTRLTNAPRSSDNPSITVSGSVVHVVWSDNRDWNREIYYKRSTDGGIVWSADTRLTINSGLSRRSSVAVSGSVVHVVWTDNSDGNYEIYYKRDPTGNVVKIKNLGTELPDDYNLYQNYPNPFNPETTIEFDIPVSSFVRLSIFDATGRELEELVKQDLTPGRYQVKWNANNYSSGLYFYRLTTDRYTSTNKMILLK
jgi:hypothetical protein